MTGLDSKCVIHRSAEPLFCNMVAAGYDENNVFDECYHTDHNENDVDMDETKDLVIQLRTVFSIIGSCYRKTNLTSV